MNRSWVGLEVGLSDVVRVGAVEAGDDAEVEVDVEVVDAENKPKIDQNSRKRLDC